MNRTTAAVLLVLGRYCSSWASSSAPWHETDRVKPGTVGPWSYVRLLGSWRQALASAGVPQDQLPVLPVSRPADHLDPVAIALRNTGDQLTMKAWDAGRLPAPSGATHARRFGSWAAA